MSILEAKTGKAEIEQDHIDLVKQREAKAKRMLDANVMLTVIPSSEKKVREAIQSSAAGKVRGEEGKLNVAIFIDPGLLGEAATAPHLRLPPLNTSCIKARREVIGVVGTRGLGMT